MKLKIQYRAQGVDFKVTPTGEEKKLYDAISTNLKKSYDSATELVKEARLEGTLEIKVKKAGE
jgi:Fe-S cluster biosynthesis and repair protein YggX